MVVAACVKVFMPPMILILLYSQADAILHLYVYGRVFQFSQGFTYLGCLYRFSGWLTVLLTAHGTCNCKLVYMCDPVCEKESYSLFNYIYLTAHNFTCELGITLQFSPLLPLT